MKPINLISKSCTPISSNCIVWQGPDISCISLCNGDTISDVTYKLATELCTLLTELSISSFDLDTIFLNNCKPESFHALIQFLIDRIVSLENCTGCTPDCNGNATLSAAATASGCPDCMVNVVTCLQTFDIYDEPVTSMQLIDYVKLIGSKICGNIDDINNTKTTLANHEKRITDLEEVPAYVYTPPTYTSTCVSSGDMSPFSFLALFEAAFCQLQGATGTASEIYTGIGQQSPSWNTANQLTAGVPYTGLSGWEPNVGNLADSVGNLWLITLDLYQAIKDIQLNCCPGACDGIQISMYATITGTTLKLYFVGTIPAGYVESNPLGSLFSISDTFGNNITRYVPIASYLNIAGGYVIDLTSTPINIISSLDISTIAVLVDNSNSTHCERYLSYTLANTATCPAVTLTSTQTTISYNFVSTLGLKTYTVQLWDAATSALLASQSTVLDIVNFVSGTFTGLVANTNYKLKIVIQLDGSIVNINCPFSVIATLPLLCIQPTGVTATFELD